MTNFFIEHSNLFSVIFSVKKVQFIDSSGFVDVEAVLKLPRFAGFTIKDVEKVVQLNDKQRFSLRTHPDSGALQIRANQGHTVKDVNPDLIKLEEPFEGVETVIHGTYEKNWESIKSSGLSRMKRNHIHFAKDMPGKNGVISGMRQDCNLHIYVHLPTATKGNLYFLQPKSSYKSHATFHHDNF